MGGLAGAIGELTEDVASAVERMRERQTHRGPDGGGTWTSAESLPARGVLVSSQRLAGLEPDPACDQPMSDPETGTTVAHDGQIYNVEELRSELEGRGATFRSQSDTEVVLRAYLAWGEACFQRLEGMFAVAIWDAERRTLLLARDRLGFKPLYLAECPDGRGRRVVLFASEVRALLASGLVDRRLDPTGLASFAWNGFVLGPTTLVRGLRSVASGALVHVPLDALDGHEVRYWHPPEHLVETGGSSGEVGPLTEALRRAVERQSRSTRPLVFFLSGGVDSSAVVSLATQVSGDPVRTLNIAFKESEFDESVYARQVATALGTDHRELRLDESFFKENLDAALASLDQPSFDALNTYLVSRAAREAGFRVALGGTGGDDLFGGNRTFVDIPKAERVGRLLSFAPRFVVDLVAPAITRWKVGPTQSVPPQTRWGKLKDVLHARGQLLELYQLFYALFTPEFIGDLLLVPSNGTHHGVPAERLDDLRGLARCDSTLYNIALLELSVFVSERLLRDIDSVSQSVGLEIRSPLLDDGVLEAWSRLDDTILFHPLGQKQALRDAAMPHLDPKLFERSKAGFVLPLERWCREGLRDALDATFANRRLCESAGIQPDTALRLWRAFQSGEPGLYWSRVWALFVYLGWCERHGVGM